MVLESWPGLPRGAQFNPSDNDLLWHLAAELGIGLARRHPFIREFIKSADEGGGFGRTHPRDIPGIRQDGHASYFFHKKMNVYNNESDKYIRWQKNGASRSLILDGNLRGSKQVFVLYTYKKNDNNPQRTDWELHQYHLKISMKDEGELVVSKIFYKSEKNLCEWAVKAPAQSAQDGSVTDSDSKEDKDDAQLENRSANMATENNFVEGNGNNQEQTLIETHPNQDKLSSCKDVFDTPHINHENQINDHAETELDHIPLRERYRILLAQKHSCSARVSAEKCETIDSEISSRQMGAETSGSVPKSESESVEIVACKNHEGTSYKEDLCSMLQEISSAPSIIDNMSGDNMRLPGEVPPDTQISPMECFAGSNEISHGPVNGKNLDSSAELPSQKPTCGHENVHLAMRNPGTYLVDVKMEPALEGYAIYPSESWDICNIVSEAASSQANSTRAEGPLPSLGVKSEQNGCELTGLCENNSINIMEPIIKTIETKTLNHNGGLAYCTGRRRNRKMANDSSEKVLEEDACKNDEGVANPSRRKRRKKTATDSIEQALEEDAPGLLQILLDRGIMVKEIKLYDVEEDDGMLPDCTESDFQDLENVIAKLFPQRASLLKSAARHAKGEKAIYCLACLISLIEQSRYLQFRDCPVEWGWCRDLQSFIFVFKSHNRLVLERPEYGYATYFFEILQSLPIEWQIRRLVTAMKLSSCGRTALIENRQLLVGEDLTEGEARVLEEYGWIPNTGLGTMLNYRDRVVHDRWNEKYSTDWRMKIGKLLMNGYSEGQLITTHMTKKLGALPEDCEVKLEDDPF